MSSQPVKICSCYLNNNTNKVVKKGSHLYAIPNIITTYAGKRVTITLGSIDSGTIVYSPAVFSITNYHHKPDKLSEKLLYFKQRQTLVPLSGRNCTQIH